ncbi:DNA-binding protein [Solimonas fluminis]|uniref:DNA-binding protein n=1 Tax=Solimonas fluminis TaxID=2086571 RepID=UPI0010570105|nr:DNA-binding protein [Solimonas fluminis]
MLARIGVVAMPGAGQLSPALVPLHIQTRRIPQGCDGNGHNVIGHNVIHNVMASVTEVHMSVSYELVVQVVEELKRKGERVSVRTVHAVIKQGWVSIQQHLQKYREQAVSADEAESAELTPALLKLLREEVTKHRRDAVAKSAAELEVAREEVEDLLREAERLTAEVETATSNLRAAEVERERMAGEAGQLRAHAEKLQERLDEERAAAEQGRVNLARARLQMSGNEDLIQALRQDIDARRAEVEAERTSRVASDKDRAAATAALEALQDRLSDLVGRVQAAEAERATLQKGLESERALRHAAERERDTAVERATAAVARAEDLATRERELRTRL